MVRKAESTSSLSHAKYLGDFLLKPFHFENLERVFPPFRTPEFQNFNHKQKSDHVNRKLLDLIEKAPKQVFLLIGVLEFIDKINRDGILINYTLSSFEIWLNQFSELSEDENYRVRSKIVGKWIPRNDYQQLFPIGMGKIYPGSHFVTAHASPDLDTTIASFWGWVDAFGARVAEGIHVWNVPGGPPASSIEIALLFYQIFGQKVFEYLAKTRTSLALSSLELMSQRGVVNVQTDQSSLMVDHERAHKAIVLVDNQGYYLGDWRSFDVEDVRQVTMLLNNCLRWFENHLHLNIISLFAKKDLIAKDLLQFVKEQFGLKIRESDPAAEYTDKQKRFLDAFLTRVLKMGEGSETTFAHFATGMRKLGLNDFQECMDRIESLTKSSLFNEKGKLIEDRPEIFHHLEEIIAILHKATQNIREYIERLDVSLKIKNDVFGYLPQVASYRDDVDELKSKMGSYSYLTVTSADEEGKMLPLGVIRARDLQQPILGTVSLRDFCNRDETKIPAYFEIISVIDHHKCVLQTAVPAVVYITDGQSSNTIVAQIAFDINDRYSTNGMSLTEIEAQIKKVQGDISKPSNARILQRLLKRLNAVRGGGETFIDPLREFVEYLHCLYAILDDTDLLTKVSKIDVECVAELLNRMKSLLAKEEVEIIQLDDLTKDRTFVQKAASRILQHPDMFSLYQKIYLAKEQLVDEHLSISVQGKESNVFADTKQQNGCCRVGQTKIFAKNSNSFSKHAAQIREIWVKDAIAFWNERREFDLHLHMISTITGAEDLYSGKNSKYPHLDELWIWIPMNEQSIDHLKLFLDGFRSSPQIQEVKEKIEVELFGPDEKELFKIFHESFLPVQYRISLNSPYTYAIIRYPAGTVNSRKAMISPYLPKLIA